jgi:hypothetical protein
VYPAEKTITREKKGMEGGVQTVVKRGNEKQKRKDTREIIAH